MSSPAKDFKVAVVGGGMVGVTIAHGLNRAGIDVQLFESAHKFDEIGAGVGIGPNACRVLGKLGLLDDVVLRSNEHEPNFAGFRFLSGEKNDVEVYAYDAQGPQDFGIGIYRPAFLEAVVPFLDPSKVHFNKRCKSITPDANGSSNTVHFTDGTTYEADLVIGADGIKSVVRGVVTGTDEGRHVVWGNTIAYRGMIPAEKLRKDGMRVDFSSGHPVCYVGEDKHIIVFSVKGGKMVNVVAFTSKYQEPMGTIEVPLSKWREPVPTEEVLQAYEGWDEDVMILLKNLENPNKWAIHIVNPLLKSYVKGKVALAGDAAHGMLPHLGAGAGQGIEDAYVLCSLLAHPKTKLSNLEDVLHVYDTLRVPRANMVSERSKNQGITYDSYGEGRMSADQLKERLANAWDPVWHHDLDQEIEAAIADL